MTVASAAEKSLVDDLRVFRDALGDSFDAAFTFWTRCGDGWRPVDSEFPAGDSRPEVFQSLGQAQAPRICPHTADTLLLAIPWQVRATPVLAVAELPAQDPNPLLRLAESTLRECELRRQVERLEHENQAFLRQVTHDFEELVFLRSMSELLEITDLSFDLGDVAEALMPTLRPLCEAETLIVFKATGGDGDLAVDGPRWRDGESVVDEQTCARLVAQYQDDCRVQPVVKNHFHETPEGQSFPEVQSFVLVPIANDSETVGWMLAVNRVYDRSVWLEHEGWEVSYYEFGTHEATLMSSTAAVLATHARNVNLFRERENLLVSVVRALVSAVEAKDQYTRGHSERVALYGRRLAEELGMDKDYCQKLYLTGLLHDIGKIGIRDAVLSKPGPLTDEEFEEIKQHPDKGWDILHDLEPLRYVLPGVLHHHEQVDGQGYPDRLVGDDIPQDGRILAVADAYDAMTSDRPYRSGMPHEKAAEILRRGSGVQWDESIIEAFLRAIPDLLRIKESYQPRASDRRSEPCRQVVQSTGS